MAGDNSTVLKDSVSSFDALFFVFSLFCFVVCPIRCLQQPQWCEMHTKRNIYGTSNIHPKFNNRISNEGTVNKGSRSLSHDRRLCVDNMKEI